MKYVHTVDLECNKKYVKMKPEIIWSSQFQFLFSPLHFLSDLGPINVFLSVQPTFSYVDCEDTVSNPYSNPVLDSLKNGAQMG